MPGGDGTTVGITYSNYAAMLGTYCPSDGNSPSTAEITMENGMYPDVGTPTSSGGNGATPPVKIANITDGTSNTIAFTEQAHGKYSQANCSAGGGCDWYGSGWWADADYDDSTITSFYPPNIQIPPAYYLTGSWQNPDGCDNGNNIPPMTAMSFHPGGVNAGFADGSVHFIKSSISSWNWPQITRTSVNGAKCTIPVGPRLASGRHSTIAGGEVISSDSY